MQAIPGGSVVKASISDMKYIDLEVMGSTPVGLSVGCVILLSKLYLNQNYKHTGKSTVMYNI